jgi:hypothetical protein
MGFQDGPGGQVTLIVPVRQGEPEAATDLTAGLPREEVRRHDGVDQYVAFGCVCNEVLAKVGRDRGFGRGQRA